MFEGSAVVGNGSSIEVRKSGKICIGKNLGNTGTLAMCSDCEINIGENVSCSWDVSIFDTDLHSYTDGQTMLLLPHMRSVAVGNYSWICQKCTLLKGAALPDWSVLGACSLLTNNYLFFDSNLFSNLFAGNPAKSVNKIIRRDDLYRISKHPNWMITSEFRIINKIPD